MKSICIYLSLSFWFLVIGAVALGCANSLNYIKSDYYTDNNGKCLDTNDNLNCIVEIKIENTITNPHVYIDINNFYAAH